MNWVSQGLGKVTASLEETNESDDGFAEGKPRPMRGGVKESVQEEPEHVRFCLSAV